MSTFGPDLFYYACRSNSSIVALGTAEIESLVASVVARSEPKHLAMLNDEKMSIPTLLQEKLITGFLRRCGGQPPPNDEWRQAWEQADAYRLTSMCVGTNDDGDAALALDALCRYKQKEVDVDAMIHAGTT